MFSDIWKKRPPLDFVFGFRFMKEKRPPLELVFGFIFMKKKGLSTIVFFDSDF